MAQLPDLALGVVIAAFIAGTIYLLGLIISKEQKTSEFRQAWIDAQALLKKEWLRVRSGEPVFKVADFVSFHLVPQ